VIYISKKTILLPPIKNQPIMSKSKPNENTELSPNQQPLFRKINYILIGAGVLFLALGFILLSGGGSDDPNVFNPAIFDTRRLVVAPILMLIGLIVEIVAIMYRAKK
jgi:hypothetical protein